jgi:hypothetical protein
VTVLVFAGRRKGGGGGEGRRVRLVMIRMRSVVMRVRVVGLGRVSTAVEEGRVGEVGAWRAAWVRPKW